MALLKPQYKTDITVILERYHPKSDLIANPFLSDAENQTFDAARIDYILQLLGFLKTYYMPGKTPLVQPIKIKGLSKEDCDDLLEGFYYVNCRRILERITHIILNLSGPLRARYKHLLAPSPFTWETFEHLGGIMTSGDEPYKHLATRYLDLDMLKNIEDEYTSKELIVEAAVVEIITDETLKLTLLFNYIQRREQKKLPATFKILPIEFLAIKALTRRVMDTHSLITLIKLVNNQMMDAAFLEHIREKTKGISSKRPKPRIMIERNVEKTIDLSTKRGQHAVLRRLELIGEFITGKNISSFIKSLDPTIDWEALIHLRDAIAHQDEGNNKAKIQALLVNKKLLKRIMLVDLNEFSVKLGNLITLRWQKLPKFNGNDFPGFWQSIYTHEKNQHETAKKAAAFVSAPITSPKEIEEIVQQLDSLNVSEQAIKNKWKSFLEGKAPIPSKKALGKLWSNIPSRNTNEAREVYKSLKKTIEKLTKPKMTQAERKAAREQREARAKERHDANQARFTGMENLRGLVKTYKQPDPAARSLSRLQKVEAAIEALENIKEFVKDDPIQGKGITFSRTNPEDTPEAREAINTFFVRLATDVGFNDALEYNAAQCLQFLDTIRQYPEARGYRYLDRNYEHLRAMRNWVTHGNYLHDTKEYEPDEEQPLLSERQKFVGPIMFNLIHNLLPALYLIKKDICYPARPHALWRSINTGPLPERSNEHDINRRWGPGFGF